MILEKNFFRKGIFPWRRISHDVFDNSTPFYIQCRHIVCNIGISFACNIVPSNSSSVAYFYFFSSIFIFRKLVNNEDINNSETFHQEPLRQDEQHEENLTQINEMIFQKTKNSGEIKTNDINIHFSPTLTNVQIISVMKKKFTNLISPWATSKNCHLASIMASVRHSPFRGKWGALVTRTKETLSIPIGRTSDFMNSYDMELESIEPIVKDEQKLPSNCNLHGCKKKSDLHANDRPNPLVILVHGVNGSSRKPYIEQAALQIAIENKWRVVVHNYGEVRVCKTHYKTMSEGYGRTDNCGKILHRNRNDSRNDYDSEREENSMAILAGGYDLMDCTPLAFLVSHLRKTNPPDTQIFAIGFSMGGTKLVNYLGRTKEHCNIDAACAISSPFDFGEKNAFISNPESSVTQRFYHFVLSFAIKFWIIAHSHELKKHPKVRNSKPFRRTISGVMWWITGSNTVMDIDREITVPGKGYFDNSHYYQECSAIKRLQENIEIPTLCITAKNDPLIPKEILPGSEVPQSNENIYLINTSVGGHIGYWLPGKGCWATRTAVAFFESVFSSNKNNRTIKNDRRKTSIYAAHNLQKSSSTKLTNYYLLVNDSAKNVRDHERECKASLAN